MIDFRKSIEKIHLKLDSLKAAIFLLKNYLFCVLKHL